MSPFDDGQLLGKIYDHAHVVDETHSETGTIFRMGTRAKDLDQWRSQLDDPGPVESIADLFEAARSYGLDLMPTKEKFDGTSLDFRVARGEDENETPWILRTPRRPDVFESSRFEG